MLLNVLDFIKDKMFAIPKRDDYTDDGNYKHKTLECDAFCWYYRKIEKTEICGRGKHFKYLGDASMRVNLCCKNKNIIPEEHELSINYVDRVIENFLQRRFNIGNL